MHVKLLCNKRIIHTYKNLISDFYHLWYQCSYVDLNTLRPVQYGRHFPDDIFKWIFLEWKCLNFDQDFN